MAEKRDVIFDFARGGGSDSEFLVGKVLFESTHSHLVDTREVLPVPTTVSLTNGLGIMYDVTVSPPGPVPEWGYKVSIIDGFTQRTFTRLVGVPAGDGPIHWTELTKFTEVIPPGVTGEEMQNWADTTEANADRAEAAADRAEAPTDQMIGTLANNPASMTTAALKASYGAFLLATDPRVGAVPGEDIAAAWARAMNILSPKGGTLYFPAGIWESSSDLMPVPSTVIVKGAGIDYSDSPTRGTIIRASSNAVDKLITLGNAASGSGTGTTTGCLMDLTVDGQNLANTPLYVQGRRRKLHNVFARRGLVCATDLVGQNCEISGQTIFEQDGHGDILIVRHEADNKVFAGAQFRGVTGSDGAAVRVVLDGTSSGAGGIASGDFNITGAHLWTGANGVGAQCKALIWIDLRNAATYFSVGIKDNILDGTLNAPKIRISIGTGCTLTALQVTDNIDFQVGGNPDAVNPWLLIEGDGALTDFLIKDNVIRGRSDGRYKSIVHDAGTGVRRRGIIDGNIAQYAQYPITAVAGSQLAANTDIGMNRTLAASSGVERKTYARGNEALTGDGVTSKWEIPTGMNYQPNFVHVSPRTASFAIRNYSLSIVPNTDKMILEFWDASGAPLAPPNGANLQFFWEARGTVFTM